MSLYFSSSLNRTACAVVTFFAVLVLTFAVADWPSLYRFAAGQSGSGHYAPLRLDDDVMISLRAGSMIRETGKASLNRSDVAEPSTSYATPYLYSWLQDLFGREPAIYAYAFLGLLCVALTMSLLVLYSGSRIVGVVLTVALCLTSTHRLYGLGGWDHLFQGLFVTGATCLSLTKNVRPRRAVVIALLLVLGMLFRPDATLLALGILLSLWFSTRQRRVLLWGLLPYVAMMAVLLAMNRHEFGHLAPTPARLKMGAAPSVSYILHYIYANGILSYSALTLFAGLLLLVLGYRIMKTHPEAIPIVVACVLTVSVALYNSDYFAGARMVWTSACVLAATFAILAPRLISAEVDGGRLFADLWSRAPFVLRVILVAYAVMVTVGITTAAIRRRIEEATITRQLVGTSPVAQQYVIARWIDANLQPKDGPIGLFFLGVSFDLPSFEVADFLGKGDEAIATLKVKQGPPGHNKWDLDRTLAKWRPQAIVPPGPVDPNLPETRENSHKHAPDLLLNQQITAGFQYCYVPASDSGVVDRWGFFLRNDIAAQHSGELRCSQGVAIPGLRAARSNLLGVPGVAASSESLLGSSL